MSKVHGCGRLPDGPLEEDQAIPGVEEYLTILADACTAGCADGLAQGQRAGTHDGPAQAEPVPTPLF